MDLTSKTPQADSPQAELPVDPAASNFSDDVFLDALALSGDPEADAVVDALAREGDLDQVAWVFRVMKAGVDQIPPEAPAPIRDFALAHRNLPPGLDGQRVARGAGFFLERPIASALVLAASSLPRIFAAPRLAKVLAISNNQARYAYRRNLGVLQLLINICRDDAFEVGGRAVVAGQKMRLLHAGIRRLVRVYRPELASELGTPLSLEDMLFTGMQFSYFVIDGLRRLGQKFSADEAEDYFYLWRNFSLLMGIHPPGRPTDFSWIPRTVDDAAAFNQAYVRRHARSAAENPDGVNLTLAQLQMLRDLIPQPLFLVGFGKVPRLAMTLTLGPEDLARVGVTPTRSVRGLRKALPELLGALDLDHLPSEFAEQLGLLFFQGLVKIGRQGEVTFTVPADLDDLRGRDFV